MWTSVGAGSCGFRERFERKARYVARVVIVGGGVLGSSAAWHLAGRGHAITVLEQFEPEHDRGSSHGSSRIFRVAYTNRVYIDLAVQALPLWRQVEEESETPVLTLTGAIDHGPESAVGALFDALLAAGQSVERLSIEAVAERWPGLRADSSAIYHRNAGRLHADHAVRALQTAAVRRGAEVLHQARVERITPRSDGVSEVITADQRVRVADLVVVAVGGWAPQMLSGLVTGVPTLRVTQEQPAHFPAAEPLTWPSFVHHGGAGLAASFGVYGLGSDDGVKVGFHAIGPVVDDLSTRDRRIDLVTQNRLQEYAAAWLPGVNADRPESLTCLYTSTPDHDFVVDRQGPIVVMTGCSGHGFKFGSVIGALAADLVEGRSGVGQFALGRDVRARVGE